MQTSALSARSLRRLAPALLLGALAPLAHAGGPVAAILPEAVLSSGPAASLQPEAEPILSLPSRTPAAAASSSHPETQPATPLQPQPAPALESSSFDPGFTLPPAPTRPVESSVTVTASADDVSLAQLQLAEKQRVLGVVPNFYASYIWDAAPLTPRQKFSLAWRFSTDPVAFLMTAAVAGSEQAQNSFPGYHQGFSGYSKRFAATYADGFNSTLIGQALLPSVLHQDPRYFVKPSGSIASQTLYALANTILCRGDNGRWQLNYSNIGGNIAAAGLSNLYYPSSNRRGFSVTVNTALLTTASGAFGNLMQQFVLRRMTPNVPDYTTR